MNDCCATRQWKRNRKKAGERKEKRARTVMHAASAAINLAREELITEALETVSARARRETRKIRVVFPAPAHVDTTPKPMAGPFPPLQPPALNLSKALSPGVQRVFTCIPSHNSIFFSLSLSRALNSPGSRPTRFYYTLCDVCCSQSS